METSEIIGRIIKVPVFVEESLAEMELGPWTGLTELEVSQRYPQEFYLWNTCPGELKLTGRETLEEVERRALEAISRIAEDRQGSPSLAVTHVALIRCLMLHFNGQDLNLYRKIYIPNASVFRLHLKGQSLPRTRNGGGGSMCRLQVIVHRSY